MRPERWPAGHSHAPPPTPRRTMAYRISRVGCKTISTIQTNTHTHKLTQTTALRPIDPILHTRYLDWCTHHGDVPCDTLLDHECQNYLGVRGRNPSVAHLPSPAGYVCAPHLLQHDMRMKRLAIGTGYR